MRRLVTDDRLPDSLGGGVAALGALSGARALPRGSRCDVATPRLLRPRRRRLGGARLRRLADRHHRDPRRPAPVAARRAPPARRRAAVARLLDPRDAAAHLCGAGDAADDGRRAGGV